MKVEQCDIRDYYAVNLRRIWAGFKRESPAFWFLCLYFSFEYLRPQSIYPWLDVMPWAEVFLALTLIFAVVDDRITWVRNVQNKLLVVFFVVILISGIFAYDPSLSWGKLKLFFNWFLVYFLVTAIVNSKRRVITFVLLLLVCSFKMSQHGFRVWAMRGFSFEGWGLTGTPGWFQNSGEFAIQMLIFLPLSIAVILALRHYWGPYKRWFFYMMPITAAGSIMGANSRGAQLALLFMGLWLVARSEHRVRVLGVTAVLGVLLYAVMPPEQLERFHDVGKDETSLQRIEYWHMGLDIMRAKPLLGVGYQNWISYCWHKHPDGIGPLRTCELPHNIFIQAGAELGYVGLAIFLGMAMCSMSLNRRTRHMLREAREKLFYNLAVALDVGLVGYLVAGFFVSVLYYPFFWVQIALSAALYNVVKQVSQIAGREEVDGAQPFRSSTANQ